MHVRSRIVKTLKLRVLIVRTLKARDLKVKLLKKWPDLNTIKLLKPLWALYVRYICQVKSDK
tara:strand:- start:115 stop:300 length:186 start_codon:yes stop_codon:yes gene_type:complete